MLEITLSRIAPSPESVTRAKEALESVLRRPETTFPSLVDRGDLWVTSEKVGADLRSRFKTVVICGIGGSSLGAQVVASVSPSSRLEFLENVDGFGFDRLMARLDLPSTGFVFVSKSGGTIETLASADFIGQILETKGLKLAKHAHVVTESKDNALGRWAAGKEVALTLIPSDVGGRYSVLSPVGMIPAMIEGLSLAKFRSGARRALERKDFIADLIARFHESFRREEWITVFFFYDGLGKMLGAWIQQLWAESLGKKMDRQGRPAPRASTPMSAVGAVDQHSFLQQLMEGPRDKFVVFIRTGAAESGKVTLAEAGFKETELLQGRTMGDLLRAEVLATEEALFQSGASTLTFRTEVLDEEGLGEVFMSMQMVVAGLGEILGLNPFDQPGVELGKRLAKEYLQRG